MQSSGDGMDIEVYLVGNVRYSTESFEWLPDCTSRVNEIT